MPDLVTILCAALAVVSPVPVGAIPVTRLPRNPIGWLLLLSGLSLALNLGASDLVGYGLDDIAGRASGADWVALLAQVTFLPFVVGLGLYVATLFQPLRRRVQPRVDRRFNRGRHDAERTVAAFAGRLRDEVDLWLRDRVSRA